MPTLENAVKRKTHKERAQPSSRRKYGLLEKKKDYKLRAEDFHKKQNTLNNLYRKAEQRNPDEFYFAMENSQTKGGVHIGRRSTSNKHTQEQLQLMRTQDMKYLTTKAQIDAKKAERLKESLHFIGAAPRNTHTVFVDSAREAAALKPEEYFDTDPELLGRAFNRPRQSQLESQKVLQGSARPVPRLSKKVKRQQSAAYKELGERLQRMDQLKKAAQEVELKKALAGKGRKRKIVREDGTAVFKWRKERQK